MALFTVGVSDLNVYTPNTVREHYNGGIKDKGVEL